MVVADKNAESALDELKSAAKHQKKGGMCMKLLVCVILLCLIIIGSIIIGTMGGGDDEKKAKAE